MVTKRTGIDKKAAKRSKNRIGVRVFVCLCVCACEYKTAK